MPSTSKKGKSKRKKNGRDASRKAVDSISGVTVSSSRRFKTNVASTVVFFVLLVVLAGYDGRFEPSFAFFAGLAGTLPWCPPLNFEFRHPCLSSFKT